MAKRMTYCDALRETTAAEMRRDKNVYLIGEDVARWGNLFGASKGLLAEFGSEQVKDCPISEAALAGCAVGSALMGMRPIAEIMYIDFITIAMDQMINHAAKYHQLSRGKVNLPIVWRTQQGVGMRNSSQHSACYENWFTSVPGMITVTPSTPADMKGLLTTAIRSDNPVLIIEHKALYHIKGEVPDGDYTIPFGVADVKREGSDITLIATSWMVQKALIAAEKLAGDGISCEVVDPRTLWPLDRDTLARSAAKTGHVIVIGEAPEAGSFASELSAAVSEDAFASLKKPVKRVCGLRTGIPYGTVEKQCVPDEDKIIAAVKEMLG